MPWDKTPGDRARDSMTYGTEWRKARQLALRRAGGRCEQCGRRGQLQVDHVIPVSRAGTHALNNLQVLCVPCHQAKTATEGGGYRARRRPADPEPWPFTDW